MPGVCLLQLVVCLLPCSMEVGKNVHLSGPPSQILILDVYGSLYLVFKICVIWDLEVG